MADPDLELRGGGGVVLDFLALLAFFPSVISSFFTQNRGEGQAPRAPLIDPPLIYYDDTLVWAEEKSYTFAVSENCLHSI